MRNIIIFDGDDTLWSTMPLYDIAKARFAASVANLQLSAEEAIRRLDEIDHANVALLGFSTERFPGSMVQAYRVLCQEAGVLPLPEVESHLLDSGQAVFTSAVVPYPDANDCLANLSNRFQLILATKGDPGVQARRVEESGFGHYFTEIRITSEKSEKQFRDILCSHGGVGIHLWSVGNSIKSDINPAIRAGLSAVLIHRPTWQYEDEPLLESPRSFVKETLAAAAEFLIERGA